VLFIPPLHRTHHPWLHLSGEVKSAERQKMREPKATRQNAAPNPSEAGATPPFDARCVTDPAGSLPPRWRKKIAPVVWGCFQSFSETGSCKGDCNHGNR
jgi:hypothetical protein